MLEEPVDVLLVEDNEDDSAFIVHALRETRLGAGIRHARDGVEALTLLFGSDATASDPKPVIKPRLIILDLKLPKVDGLDLLRRLKSNPHTRLIPVVVLSSSQEKRDLTESYQLGANSFLVKPMDFDDFAETVQTLGLYWIRHNQTSNL